MKLRSLSAIVAGDHKVSRDIFSSVLASGGLAEVRQAIDGGDAFQKICAKAPDLIVLDFDLLHDSISTLRQIRRAPHSPDPKIAVLIITSSATRAGIQAMRDAGVTEILRKPLTSSVLLTRIESMMSEVRPFVSHDAYVGPDRRRNPHSGYNGPFRRADEPGSLFQIDVA